MAIEIAAEGSREAVIKHIESLAAPELKPGDPEVLGAQDNTQLPLIKSFLIAEVNNLETSTSFNSVRVVAFGYSHAGHRHFKVDIIPRKLHL